MIYVPDELPVSVKPSSDISLERSINEMMFKTILSVDESSSQTNNLENNSCSLSIVLHSQ